LPGALWNPEEAVPNVDLKGLRPPGFRRVCNRLSSNGTVRRPVHFFETLPDMTKLTI
jgi:hypothetical protein